MSPVPVPDNQLVCVHCPKGADGRPPVVGFRAEQDQVRCPGCRRWYRVLTRTLAAPTQQMPLPEEGLSRYRIVTTESGGRELARTFVAGPGLRLAIGARISLVYQAGRMVGIANQTTGVWFKMPPARSSRTGRWLELALLALAAALAVGLLVRAADQALASAALISLLIVIGAALAVPWLRDLLRTDAGPERPGPPAPATGQKGSRTDP